MATFLQRYCCHETIRLAAGAVLATALLSCGMMFYTASANGTALGPHLGADYAAFHTAGLVQNRHGISSLYDLALQDRVLHAAVPGMPEEASLPFVYPPFVAPAFRVFAALPYAWSFAAWLVLGAVIYAAAIAMTLRVCPALSATDRTTIWLLALSFSPFAVEAWLGGQMSVVGVLAIALAGMLLRGKRDFLAGLSLALLLYKPTLPALFVLMLLCGRRWRTLAGFVLGGTLLAAASVMIVGIDGSLAYAELLRWYGEQREHSPEVFRTFKFLDLTTSLTLAGIDRGVARIIALMIALPTLGLLAVGWHRAGKHLANRDLVWAATLCCVPLLTNYGPIYDAALLVPGMILAADAVRARNPHGWPAGFLGVVGGVYLAALVSPFLAQAFGAQALTPALWIAGLALVRTATARGDIHIASSNDAAALRESTPAAA